MSSTPVNMWPAVGSAIGTTIYGGYRLTIGSCAALAEGGAAATAGTAPTLISGGTWIDSVINWVKTFSFNGNTSARAANVFGEFWTCIGKLNFKGFGDTIGKLSPSGMGIAGLTAAGGIAAVLLAARNIMTDYRSFDDASHGRSMEIITNPAFHLGKLVSDGVMGAGGLMMLGGSAAGGLPVFAFGLIGVLACKGIEWFNSANNPLNNEGATMWAPFNYLIGAGRSHTINNNPMVS